MAPVKRRHVPVAAVSRPKVIQKVLPSTEHQELTENSNLSNHPPSQESFPLLLQKKHSKKSKRAPTENYDPSKPNEYDICKAEAKRRKHEERNKRSYPPEDEADRRSDDERHSDYSVDGEPFIPISAVKAATPVVFEDASGEEAYRRRTQLSGAGEPVTAYTAVQQDKSGEDAYRRRMMLSQTSSSSLVPVAPITESLLTALGECEDDEEYDSDLDGVPLNRPDAEEPTEIILLCNLVGPGEVDPDLEEETASECSKYGKVEKCLIFEVAAGQASDDEAVRIFVKFCDIDAAVNAMLAAKSKMDGRFFGGRKVSATFFSKDRFERLDLAP
ncbi:hypothetical protein HDU67_007742 [Dinochytrium kinnereticum]|nr:hypothetical protein HDU67_007742 [Dinochytrium kinnereticum]